MGTGMRTADSKLIGGTSCKQGSARQHQGPPRLASSLADRADLTVLRAGVVGFSRALSIQRFRLGAAIRMRSRPGGASPVGSSLYRRPFAARFHDRFGSQPAATRASSSDRASSERVIEKSCFIRQRSACCCEHWGVRPVGSSGSHLPGQGDFVWQAVPQGCRSSENGHRFRAPPHISSCRK